MFGWSKEERQQERERTITLAYAPARLTELEHRLSVVEAASKTKVGEIAGTSFLYGSYVDSRKEITAVEMCTLLAQHLGLEFKEERGTPAKVVLTKPEGVQEVVVTGTTCMADLACKPFTHRKRKKK